MLGNGPITVAAISGEEPTSPLPIVPVYRRRVEADDEETYSRRAGR